MTGKSGITAANRRPGIAANDTNLTDLATAAGVEAADACRCNSAVAVQSSAVNNVVFPPMTAALTVAVYLAAQRLG
jgi:hypothetical protein